MKTTLELKNLIEQKLWESNVPDNLEIIKIEIDDYGNYRMDVFTEVMEITIVVEQDGIFLRDWYTYWPGKWINPYDPKLLEIVMTFIKEKQKLKRSKEYTYSKEHGIISK